MYCTRMLVIILHGVNGWLQCKHVCVQFRNESEGIAEIRRYSASCAIFRMSQRLSLELSKIPKRISPYKDHEIHVRMDVMCSPHTFEIALALCDGSQPSKISAEDISGILRLAEYLGIQGNCKAEFYMALANMSDIASIRKEKSMCFGTNGAKMYVLQLLRTHVHRSGLVAMVMRERVTLCTRSGYDLERVYGSTTEVGAVNEVKVPKHAMSSVAQQDREVLFWLGDVLGTQKLDLSGCDLDEGTMVLISGMKSLTVLDISNCTLEPESIKHLQKMGSLRELMFMWNFLEKSSAANIGRIQRLECLDISCCMIEPGSIINFQGLESLKVLYALGITLNSNSVSEIGGIQSLEKLRISRCKLCPGSLKHLLRLKSLRELGFSHNRLCRDDTEELAKMTSLSVLDISNCELKLGCLVHLARLCLKELCVSYSKLHNSNILGIRKIRSLVKLEMHECKIKPGSFSLLRKLKNLRDLCVSCNELSRGDLAAICKMQSLEKLNISCCKIKPGSLKHIGKLHNLRELYVSHNSMSRDEHSKIKKLRLDKLEDHACTIESKRPRLLQKMAEYSRLLFI